MGTADARKFERQQQAGDQGHSTAAGTLVVRRDRQAVAGEEGHRSVGFGDAAEIFPRERLEEVHRAIDADAMGNGAIAAGDEHAAPGANDGHTFGHTANVALAPRALGSQSAAATRLSRG